MSCRNVCSAPYGRLANYRSSTTENNKGIALKRPASLDLRNDRLRSAWNHELRDRSAPIGEARGRVATNPFNHIDSDDLDRGRAAASSLGSKARTFTGRSSPRESRFRYSRSSAMAHSRVGTPNAWPTSCWTSNHREAFGSFRFRGPSGQCRFPGGNRSC
jgi:hypothetical protein